MKIIEPGSLTRTVKHEHCGTIIEYEPEDVNSTTYGGDGDPIEIKYHIWCPFCEPRVGKAYSYVYVVSPSQPREDKI